MLEQEGNVNTAEPVESADSSSQSENAETQSEVSSTEEAEVKTDVSDNTEEPSNNKDDVDDSGVSYKNRAKEYERKYQKLQTEIDNMRRQQEEAQRLTQQQSQRMSQQQIKDYYDQRALNDPYGRTADELMAMDKQIDERAYNIANAVVAPVLGIVASKQFEDCKKQFRNKDDYEDFSEIEAEIDKLEAEEIYDKRIWSNPEVAKKSMQQLIWMARGKYHKNKLREAEDRGKRKGLEKKRIEEPKNISGGSASSQKNKGTLSVAEDRIRQKSGMTIEDWIAAKEGLKSQSHRTSR